MMKGWSIWTRLLLAVGLITCIAGALLAGGMALVLRAERDFRDLAGDRIPRVALAGELAEFTGELAALSAEIAAGALAGPATGQIAGPVPDRSGANPLARVAAATAGVDAVLADPALRLTPAARALAQARADLATSLAGFTATTAALRALAAATRSADDQLRWTHGDVQDQVGALLQDLSFNMESLLRVLVADPDLARRSAAETVLAQNRHSRDRLQRLGTEAATLSALLLQARAATDLPTLEQVERLGHDTLDALALLRSDLPRRVDVGLVLDGVDRLVALAQGEGGVFGLMRSQIALRETALGHLTAAQAALGAMQDQLTRIGRAERLAAQSAADTAAGRMLWGAAWLTGLTLAGVATGAAILLLFVRNRIVRRIRRLTDDLVSIADGGAMPPPPGLRGQDEIARMAHAVGVFRASVADLKAAHHDLSAEVAERRRAVDRLEVTQRELVQAGKMAALGQMSAAISHEINQPLAAMRHRLHGLRLSHPEVAAPVARIEAMTDRISATISHLRRIARRSDHRRVRVVLAEPLDAALDLLHHRLRDGSVDLRRPPGLGQMAIEGDTILVEQVLLNVLGNALDAIAETGSGRGTISLALLPAPAAAGAGQGPEGAPDRGDVADPQGDVVLVVRDTGVGLRGRTGADLVDPFFTTKEVGHGLGLGLSIAFNVMQDMGGGLAIQPAAGGGAEVHLRFRRWTSGRDTGEPAAGHAPASGPASAPAPSAAPAAASAAAAAPVPAPVPGRAEVRHG